MQQHDKALCLPLITCLIIGLVPMDLFNILTSHQRTVLHIQAAFKDDTTQHVEEDDEKPVSTEDGVRTPSRETNQNKVNGITNSRSKHSDLSHSTRDQGFSGQDRKGKVHERERHRRSSSSSLVCSGSKGSKANKTKYFIIKSLNHHNIEKSVENGIWATQAMNEPVLNEAFETADRVILVFSVNMSGHFQGYAQMASPIGRRRANVWSEANAGANPWGGSFSVDWLRLYDLPFQKTVHLKNPLNFFKPVKISRDCQELAEEVGQALCGLIDEGADREGRPKRKVPVADLPAMSLKRRHKELPALPDGSQSRQHSSVRRNDSTSFPVVHPSRIPQGANQNRSSPGPVSRFSRGLSSDDSSFLLEPPRGSKSKSPHPASSERSWDREQDNGRERPRRPRRPLERNVVRDRTRSRSSGRSADLPMDEDLLNMTYEDYLQRHGHSREFNNGYQQGPGRFFPNSVGPGYAGGWRGTNAGMGFPEDQYSDYVTNWYTRQQGPPMGRDAFFETGGGRNNYPVIRPPDAH